MPGRPWYRHQVYAPKFTYAPELLPSVSEALDAGDQSSAALQALRLADSSVVRRRFFAGGLDALTMGSRNRLAKATAAAEALRAKAEGLDYGLGRTERLTTGCS